MECRQGSSHTTGHALACALVRCQRRQPRIRDAVGGIAKTRRKPVELNLRRIDHSCVHQLRFPRNPRHCSFHRGLDALAGRTRACRQAVLERFLDRAGEMGINVLDLAVKALLIAEQLRLQLLVPTLDLLHQRLQLVDHIRQGLGLQLQRPERLLALVGERKPGKHGCNSGVQQLRRQHPLAPAQCRQQAQHGRSGNTRHRRTKRQPQSLDRCRKRGPDRLQVGGAFQRKDGAIEGDDHAQERAQHPQHHQQPHQIRGQGGPGQAETLTFYAQTHGVLERRMQAVEPIGQIRQLVGNRRQRRCQRCRGATELAYFKRAEQIDGSNDRRHGQGQRIRADKANAYPPHSHGPQQEDQCENASIHLTSFASFLNASMSPAVGCKRRSSSASSTPCNSLQKSDSHSAGGGRAAGESACRVSPSGG